MRYLQPGMGSILNCLVVRCLPNSQFKQFRGVAGEAGGGLEELMHLLERVDPTELGVAEKRALIRFLREALAPQAVVAVDDAAV